MIRRRAALTLGVCAALVAATFGSLAQWAPGPAAAQDSSHVEEVVDRLDGIQRKLGHDIKSIRNGELTKRGISARARGIVRSKLATIEAIAAAGDDVFGSRFNVWYDALWEVGQPLARAEDAIPKGNMKSGARKKILKRLRAARDASDQLVDLARAGEGSQATVACFEGLKSSLRKLASDAKKAKSGAIRRGITAAENERLECLEGFPTVMHVAFGSVYSPLDVMDLLLEEVIRGPGQEKRVLRNLKSARGLSRALEDAIVAANGDGSSPTSPPPSSEPTSTETQPTSTDTGSPTPTSTSGPPAVSPIEASFDPDAHETNYGVTATDPDGDLLSYAWVKDGEDCGEFHFDEDHATWEHPHLVDCPNEDVHEATISVFVSDGVWECVATYEGGSAEGTGEPATCQRI